MRAYESYRARFASEPLKELYYARVGVRPTVGLDKMTGKRFEEDLDENIAVILRKTANGTYHFTNYRQMLMLKGKDSPPRELCIPTVRDKLTLAAVSQLLDDVYGSAAVSPMPQPIIDDVVEKMRDGSCDAFAKYDIERFFSSVDHDILMRVLGRKVRKREVVHLIQNAIKTPSSSRGIRVRTKRKVGVPEGLSISGKLANIYADDIDRAFEGMQNVTYRRYVDDILVLCKKSDLPKVQATIERALGKLSLVLNREKTVTGEIGKDAFSYLGYRFLPDGTVSVRPQSIRKLERALDEIIGGRNGYPTERLWLWRLNLRITGCRITMDGASYERYGWIHYFSRITDKKLLWRLDWLVGELLRRRGIEKPNELRNFMGHITKAATGQTQPTTSPHSDRTWAWTR